MPNIKPVSDLRNYASVLNEVRENEAVYLTKNGRGAYAIIDIKDYEEYEKAKAALWLMSEIQKGMDDVEKGNTVTKGDIIKYFKDKHSDD